MKTFNEYLKKNGNLVFNDDSETGKIEALNFLSQILGDYGERRHLPFNLICKIKILKKSVDEIISKLKKQN